MSTRADSSAGVTDEELVTRVATRDESALRALHQRYAALVFTVAARLVDTAAAEEVVQDVFMTLWRKHDRFDPARGALKSWLCQVARHAALNVRRRQARVPTTTDDDGASEIADESLQPDEALWMAHRQAVLRAAVDALPERQREALSLAYLEELTQEQVAAALRAPLGTTKSRIRQAMRRLAPVIAAALCAALLVLWWRRTERDAHLEERALTLVTSSDIVPLRLEPTTGVPREAHATYRARPGGTLAVLTASHLPPLEHGEHYVGWVRHDDTWLSLGELDVHPDGSALRVFEDAALARHLDEIAITKESRVGPAPRGLPVVVWPPH